jgi:peptidoglycan hydrolase-like protein with peptidoglycan-binding domain
MNQITSPLQPGSQGPAVADLQDALLLLIECQLIKTLLPLNRPIADELQTLAQGLKQERTQSTFGDATRQLVRYFQNQQGLGDSFAGIVEAKTAQIFNKLLTNLGAFAAIILNTVSGAIYDIDNSPMINVTIQVYDKDLRFEQLLG